jgi:hypothetical protein
MVGEITAMCQNPDISVNIFRLDFKYVFCLLIKHAFKFIEYYKINFTFILNYNSRIHEIPSLPLGKK